MSYKHGSFLYDTSHEAFVGAWSDHLADGDFTTGELASLAEDSEEAQQMVRAIRADVGLPTIRDVSLGSNELSPEIEADEEDHVWALQTAAERMAAEEE